MCSVYLECVLYKTAPVARQGKLAKVFVECVLSHDSLFNLPRRNILGPHKASGTDKTCNPYNPCNPVKTPHAALKYAVSCKRGGIQEGGRERRCRRWLKMYWGQ